MIEYSNKELELINMNKPVDNIDTDLINSIIKKILVNKEYSKLISFLNKVNDFTKISIDIITKLIEADNKECISEFLENESSLYFLSKDEIDKLKEYLNAYEINIKLDKTYEYYYNLLYMQGIRLHKVEEIDDNVKEYTYKRNNKDFNIKLRVIKNNGLFVSYTNFHNYNLEIRKQLIEGIKYLNQFGFEIEEKTKFD